MTREQYRRADKVVFPVMVLILGYLVAAMGLLVAVNADSAGWYTYVEMAAALAGLVIVVIAFLVRRGTKMCGVCMMAAGALVYAVFRLVGTSEGTSIYGYPILIASMVYLNIRLVIWGNSAIVGVNVIRVLTRLDSLRGPDAEAVILNLLVCFLVAFASIKITKLLVKFNEENTGAREHHG